MKNLKKYNNKTLALLLWYQKNKDSEEECCMYSGEMKINKNRLYFTHKDPPVSFPNTR